jgi:hypothetical protein
MINGQENVHGFVMLRSYYEAIKDLPDSDRLSIVDAIFRYVFEAAAPESLSPHLAGYFILLRPNIDSSVRKYAAQKSNGAKGGRPPKPKDNPSKTQLKPNGNQEKDTDTDMDKEREKEIYSRAASQRSADTRFEQFWQVYPKKRDKQRAEKAFSKAIGKTGLETMLQALAVQKQSPDWLKDGGQYIPLATTWLNGCRWEDETEAAQGVYSYVPRPDILPEYED